MNSDYFKIKYQASADISFFNIVTCKFDNSVNESCFTWSCT